jgi:heme A synthase
MNRPSVGLLGLLVVAVMMGATATPSAAQTPYDKMVLPKLDPQLPPPRPDIPPMPPPRQTALQEFLKNNQFLHAPLFAAAVTLAFVVFIWAPVVICRTAVRALRRARSAKPLVLIAGGLVACAGLGLYFFGLRSEEAVFLPFGAALLVLLGLIVVALGLPRASDGGGA